MNIFYKFFEDRPWLGWICLILLLRLIFSLFAAQPESFRFHIFETLVEKALFSKERQVREISFQTLYHASKSSPLQREYINNLVKEKISGTKNVPQDIQDFLGKLKEDPEEILKSADESLSSFDPQEVLQILFYIILLFAVSLLFCTPLLLLYFVGPKSLLKIFGKYASSQLLLGNIIIWGLCIFYKIYDIKYLIFLQAALAGAGIVVFWRLVKSKMLSIFLGITQESAWKTFQILAILTFACFIPYFISSRTADINGEALKNSIDRVVKENRKSALPQLVNLLRKSGKLPRYVTIHIVQAIGSLGEESSISHLTFLLNSSDNKVQIACLEAISKIVARSNFSSDKSAGQ